MANSRGQRTWAVEDGYVLGGQRGFALDADQEGRAATGCNNLARKVFGLEAQSESAFLSKQWQRKT